MNALGTSWKAAVGEADAKKPLHSSRHLYGVTEGSREEFLALTKIQGSGFVMAPKITAEEAASIPDSFQSAEAWPQCAQVGN